MAQTRDEHLVQIRGHLKLRPYVHAQDQPRLTAYLLTRACSGRSCGAVDGVVGNDFLEWPAQQERIPLAQPSSASSTAPQDRPAANARVKRYAVRRG